MTTRFAGSASKACFARIQRHLILALCGVALAVFPRSSWAQQVTYYDFNAPAAASPSASSTTCNTLSGGPAANGVQFCFNYTGAGLSFIQDSYPPPIDPNASSDGDSGSSNTALQLTESAQSQDSSVWYSTPLNVEGGFNLWYTVKLNYQYLPPNYFTADGLAFVIQNSAGGGTDSITNCAETGSGLTVLGGGGGGIGYCGIDNSLALEMDTFYDAPYDPDDSVTYFPDDLYDDNHMALQSCGAGNANSVAHLGAPNCLVTLGSTSTLVSNPYTSAAAPATSSAVILADGNPHQVAMVYNGPNDTPANYLWVYLDPAFNPGTHTPVAGSTPLFSGPFDITQYINLTNGNAYIGFTAANGGDWEQHELMGFSFTPHGYGNANVCPTGQTTPAPCSAALTETFNFTTSTTIGSVQVVTQGATGLDFTQTSNSTCTGTIAAGNSCTVNVTFAPLAPGLRLGAVQLLDSLGNVLATKLVYGIGQGPATAFSPLTTFVESTGPYTLSGPTGVTVDAAGDIFVADAGNGRVVEVGANGSFQTVGTGLQYPQGLAVDGAGDLFIADNDLNEVVEVPAGCTNSSCQQVVGSGLSSQLGVAVDGPGDVFISDFNGHDVVEVPANGGPQTVVYSPVTSPPTYSEPVGLAVDAAGDLFIADYGLKQVAEVPAGCASSSCQTTVGSGWSAVEGVAVDAAGDVYVADAGLNAVIEVPAGCVSASCQITVASTSQVSLGGGFKPYDVAVDGQGDLFIADYGNDRVDAVLQQFNGLNFAQSTVDNISGDSPQSILFQNIGNQQLSATSPGLVFTDPDFYQVPGSGTFADCTAAFSLTPGATCNLSVDFDPLSPGSLSGSAVFTDNALNANPGSQTVPFNGSGLGGATSYTLTVTEPGSGSGTVTDNVDLITCGETNGSITNAQCSATYSSGTGVTLTASVASGSTFTGWGGACAPFGTSPICVVTMSAAQNVSASFSAPIAYTAPTTTVNTTSAVETATVTFGTAGTLGAISVVTQGAAGKDYNVAAGGTCGVGTVYSVGQGCTVNYTFTPLFPGGRNGAVVLTDGSGNVLGTSYLSGIGVGPQGLFDTAPQTVSISGLTEVRGLSTDGNGNLYALELSGSVDEFPAGTNNEVQLATVPVTGGATAVDGAGNLFVATSIGNLYELVGGTGPANLVANILGSDNNLEIDGAGNLYFSGYGASPTGAIYEIPAGTTQATTLIPGGVGRRFVGMAIDAAGDLFAADFNNNVLYELPAGTTSLVTLASGGYLSNPHGVAVDPAGNIYVTNVNGSAVIRYAAGTYAATLLPEAGQRGIALDSAGNMYTITSDSTIAGYARTQASPLTFVSTAVGTTSDSQQGDIFENDGNAGLAITGYSATAPFALGGPQNTCSTGTLAAGASCVVGATFTPTAAATVGGTGAITDNNLGVTGASQTVSLSGTGVVTNYTLTVTETGTGFGTVNSGDGSIDCISGSNNNCSASYASGTPVTLTANAIAGSAFMGWGGACASAGTNAQCIVPVNAAENAIAIFSQQNLGNINVCPSGVTTPSPCNSTQAVTFNIAATTTFGATQVVTQGITGLDFTLGSGSTCVGTVSAGNTCTVNVNFAPLAPGLRTGAVELFDNNGNLVATAPIYGIGQGPAIAFGPGTQTDLPVTLPGGASGVAVDAAGDVFISGGAWGAIKLTPSGVQSTVPTIGVSSYDVALDGAGDVYLADSSNNRVVEVTPSGVQTTVPATGLSYPTGVAVDGAGDLFITDRNNNRVVKVTPSGVQTTVPTSGVIRPFYPAVDAAGDIFFLDSGNERVLEVTPGGVQTTVPLSGLAEGNGVAVDAAGDVFITDQVRNLVFEVTPSGVQTTVPTSGLSVPAGLAVDAAGDVFIAVNGQSRAVEVSRSQLPSLSFALTNVGSTSVDSPQLVSVQNVGNQPLTGSLGFSLGGNFTQNASPDCSGEFPLAPGASCIESFSFTPQTTGYLTGTASFSDNTLNLSQLVVLQTINLSGNGGLNGQPVGVTVPNVVGLAQTAATTMITGTGLTAGTVSTASSSIVPSGSVIASNPAAGTQVSVGSAVRLLVSNGQAPPPMPNPLSLENNYFVTGDYASAGVTLRGLGVGGIATGTITIPDSTTNTNAIQGVPDGADIIDAFLYWETLESTPSASATNGTFNQYPIAGQQIGSDMPSYTDGAFTGTLRAYRADVNAYFPVGANGVRTASGGFAVSLPDGGGSALPLTEGASLVVIYRVLSPNFPLKSVVIYDGSAAPTTSTTQNVLGFYDSTGTGENTNLFAAAGSWNNSSSSVPLGGHASQFSAPLNAGNAYAAVILSTPVSNSDNDGILDAWKTGPGAGDFYAGQAGYYDAKTGSWVALPGALHGEKDLFVQLDYMCGAVLSDGSCDPSQENLFPAPDTLGNDPLAMVKSAFAADGVVLHLEIGNAVPETTCTDNLTTTPPQLCQFPSEPGVIGWKNSLEFSKLWPRNLASCAAGGDCSIRFPYGQKDSYHYVLFGHSLAIPAWNTRYGTLTAISVVNGVTTISTANRGASGSINYCPSRITISGVLGNPSLNGVYNTTSCPDAQTIIAATPGVANWSYPNSTLPEPVIGLTSGTVTSISGYSDLGGADSAVTLGLWETAPNQNMSKRANVIAGTLFHEIGHTLGLTHGGLYYDSSPSYVPNFDVNCKPNYQSVMNYLFQLDGVGPNATVAYSNQSLLGESASNQLAVLNDASLGAVTNLTDGSGNPATYSTTAWYTPTAPSPTASAATLHCDGTPLTGDTGYRVNGTVAPISPAWANGQNITFDGVPYTTMRGYNDVANLDLRQVGATGGEFASLSTILSFGSSVAPLNIAAGGNVTLGSGGTVALGSGKSVTLSSGGNVTLGSGGTITLGSGKTLTLSSGGNVTLGSGGTITLGSGKTLTLSSGGNVTLGSGGTITLGSGQSLTLSSGGNVTLGSGGTIALGSGGSVTIPSSGGSYTIDSNGGTVTLGSGGTVTLGSGGNVTLGSGGTIAFGSGGTVALGSGGNVTLGSGGTIAFGSGGTVALGSGGTVTLGSGGTIALGSGGTVTLGSGGNVTLGSGGTVTLGSGGNIALGSGGNVTLGSGGTATLGAGGTVTLGSGGNVTLGSGGNVTLGSGGTIAMGSGGNVTLGSGGTVTLGSGGDTITPGSGGTITLGSGGNVTLGSGGTITLGSGGTITLGSGGTYTIPSGGGTITPNAGGNVTLGSGGNVTLGSGGTIALGSGGTVALGSGGNVTLGSGGTITMGSGGTVALGSGGTVTLGSGGVVALGSGGNVTLGSGGTIALGSGGNVTLGSGGATTNEMDYFTANSVVRPPSSPTETPMTAVAGAPVVLNWTAPAFGVVATYTIYRSVNGGTPVEIGSVSGVNGNPPATTFTDTNPAVNATTVAYTISTTLLPIPVIDPAPRQSVPSPPAVLTNNQTIVLGALPSSVTMGSSQPTVVTATAETNGAANGLQVSFSATGQCAIGNQSINAGSGVSSATVILNSTGSCTITASQAGASGYNAANSVSGTFTILAQGSSTQSQTINFPSLPNVQYGNTFSFSATSSVGQTVSFTASGPCTTSGKTTGAGVCAITASAAATSTNNGSYSAASLTQSFTIVPATLTVTASNVPITYGQTIPALTSYTFGTFVNGDTAAVVNGAPALFTTATTGSPAGSYPITVTTGTLAAANYSFLYVSGTLTIQQANQAALMVTGMPAAAQAYGATFTVGSSGGSGTGAVTFASSGACSVGASTGLVTMTSGTGTCSVTASKAADTNYSSTTSAAATVSAKLAAQATLMVTGMPAAAQAYGATFTVGSSGGSGTGAVTFASSGACSVGASTGLVTMTSGTGTCSVTASKAADTNYNSATSAAATVSAKLATQATLTVTGMPAAAQAYGATFTVASSGGSGTGAVTFASSGACSVGASTGLVTMTSGTGTCSVTASKAADTNYSNATSAAATVSAKAANQAALVLTAASPLTYNQSEPVSLAGGSTGGTVTYSVTGVSGGSCSLTGTQLKASIGSGSCTVSATMAGNSNYNPVTSNTATVTLQPASQAITFTTNAPSSAVYNSSFTVAATGGASGNAVTFTSSGSCSNSGAKYTMTSGTGTCSVIANQAGSTNYYTAAPQVTQTASATLAAQAITFTTNPPASAAYNGSFTVAASASSGLAVAYTSSGVCTNSGATYTMTNSTGTCSVIASQAGNTNYAAAAQVTKSVTATGPVVTVSPSNINFGTVYLGSVTTNNITVSNVGTGPVTINTPVISIVQGGNSNEFVAVNLCPTPLAAGKSCTITIAFVAGPYYTAQTATLKIMDNAPGSPQPVTLSAQVIDPLASFSPTSLAFGTVKHATSSTMNVTLSNTGATPLIFSGAGISVTGTNAAAFAQSNTCGSSLAAGAKCTIAVKFTPPTTGTFKANLTVVDNVQACGAGQTVALSGTGN